MILIVDDLDSATLALSTVLRHVAPREELKPCGVAQAQAILLGQVLRMNRRLPTAVFMQLQLHLLAGQRFVEWFKGNLSFVNIPLIGFRVGISEAERLELMASGVTDVFAMPREFEPAEKIVREMLTLHAPLALRTTDTEFATKKPSQE